MHTHARAGLYALAVAVGLLTAAPLWAQTMLIGIDNKVSYEGGKQVAHPPGNDAVLIVDIKSPLAPKIVASLPLMNTLVGPPVNLQITPDGSLALVANSLDWVKDGENWKGAPDTKLYIIDLKASPPALIDTVTTGKQPSGLAINPAGNLALVTNRAENSVSVLSITGKSVKVIDTVPMGDVVTSAAFTPDGKHALVSKFNAHKIALLDVDGTKVTYNKYDMPVGLWPYNVQIASGGKIALTSDNGNSGQSDGNIDTVSVIDLEATPPRVIDRVVVGDGPEGLVISPKGNLAAAILLNGTNAKTTDWWYHKDGAVAVLKIAGKKVTKVGEVAVGGLPEGAVFSPDGQYLYVGNFMTDDVSILQVKGGKLVNTGKTLKLPGHPASMRGVTP